MVTRYSRLATAKVPVSEPLTPNQVKNNAGGFVFQLDDWKRLDRFLILGSDANTYYQKAPTLTRENAQCVTRCYDADPERTVKRIVEVSVQALAPKNDSAIFALAMGAAHKDLAARQKAAGAVQQVCRTATHLFQFYGLCKALGRGRGRSLNGAMRRWYETKTPAQLGFQVIKYRNREGFGHGDMMKLVHPAAKGDAQKLALFNWLRGREHNADMLPMIVQAHIDAMAEDTKPKEVLRLIKDHKLPWEAVPTSYKKDPAVWKMLLPHMGLTAAIRNLGAMTAYEALKPLSDELGDLCKKLNDVEELRKARIHPFTVLQALVVYGGGQNVAARRFRGSEDGSGLSWTPIPKLVSALDKAFYLSFKAIEPTGKRYLVGLDVSGSMSSSYIMNSPITACQASAAMSMVTMRTEEDSHVLGFDSGLRDLGLNASMSLEDIVAKTAFNGGGTNCSLPMEVALRKGWKVDVFQIHTDNETWDGGHPAAALQEYRNKTGINAKMVVIGFTSTGFSIADPNDPGMLDVVGFDSSAPAVIANFARQ